MLDPNAYASSEEEEKMPLSIAKGQDSSSEDSFELTPEQQFNQDHQKEIAQFKQMLKELNVDVVHSTF